MICPLRFAITPLSPDLTRRTLFAHTVRGISWQLTSPASLPITRCRLDFAFVLGLSPHVRWYSAPSRHSAKPTAVHAHLMLRQVFYMWQRGLHDLDLNAIHLALCSLTDTQLDPALVMLDKFRILENFSAIPTLPERAKLMLPSTTIPADIMNKLGMSLASLEQSLLAKDPMMPQHLRSTHSLLITYPETVNLLADSEIALIIDAAEVHTKTEIVKPGATKGASGESKKKITSDDL